MGRVTLLQRAERSDALLSEGLVLATRYKVSTPEDADGFGASYYAADLRREEEVTLWELFPAGVSRRDNGQIDWTAFGDAHAFRLRHLVLDEARRLSRVRSTGIPRVRDAFTENATAYVVLERVSRAESLEEALKERGKLSVSDCTELLRELGETLAGLHRQGALLLAISPRNVLLRRERRPLLLGFGLARSWHRDSFGHSEEADVPLAPEMLDPMAGRGPETDIFLLCATIFRAFAGIFPPQPELGSDSAPMIPLRMLDEPTKALAETLSAGLQPALHARPKSIDKLLSLLEPKVRRSVEEESLEEFDERAVRLMSFRFHKRQCPACEGLLEYLRPLKPLGCPVCRDGTIRKRRFEARLCPICRLGALRRIHNAKPIKICPICRSGILAKVRKKLFSKQVDLRCPECEAMFDVRGHSLILLSHNQEIEDLSDGVEMSAEAWRMRSGRAEFVWACDSCEAQFDLRDDGRRELVQPPRTGRPTLLYPDEWIRVADGLRPGCGGFECEDCRADFDVIGDQVTVLDAPMDPYEFGARYLNRPIPIEDTRWLGIGKRSHHHGLVCQSCGTEFDKEEGGLRLVQTRHARLSTRPKDVMSREDWHRFAKDLPLANEEGSFEADFDQALVEAYERGEISYRRSRSGDVLWRGRATRLVVRKGARRKAGSGWLTVTEHGARFQTLLKPTEYPLEGLTSARSEPGTLILEHRDFAEPIPFELGVLELKAKLRSGKRKVLIAAENVARRLSREMRRQAARPSPDAA